MLMAQVTIYLDKETAEKKCGLMPKPKIFLRASGSLIREKLQTEWPDHVAALAGAWTDFPTLAEIRGEISVDIEREPL
jgi:hypothetical protein